MTVRGSALHDGRRKAAVGAGTLLLGFCTLAAAVGQVGRVWAPADAGNYLMPLWLVLGCVGALPTILFSPGMRLYALVATGLLALCAADRMVPELNARFSFHPVAGPADLRLIQFNLEKNNIDPEGTARWIEAQHADVVVLEEAALIAATIPPRLAADLPYQARCFARRPCSTMILSRRPFRAVLPLGRGDPENHRGRSMLAVAIDGPGGPFVLVGIHLAHPWPINRQTGDLAALGPLMAMLPRRDTIVAGDFNMPPWAFAMERQDRLIGLPRVTRALATWPVRIVGWRTGPPMLPFDHVYAGTGWRAVRVSAGPTLGSDHRPVVVDLRWMGSEPAKPAR